MPGQHADELTVTARDVPVDADHAGGPRPLDVAHCVVDEEHLARVRADPSRGLEEEPRVRLGEAELARVPARVELGVVAERLPHERHAPALLVGAEVHAVAARAERPHEVERRVHDLERVEPDRAVHVLRRFRHAVPLQARGEHGKVVAVAHEHGQVLAPRLADELVRAVAQVAPDRRVPAVGDVLEHAVGVEQDVAHGHGRHPSGGVVGPGPVAVAMGGAGRRRIHG
ncbi:hypothetical protein M2316_001416 [Cellulosimicrobium cellulans]|nr:hypothetical protein [Cellulosimicrobium cellulans]